MFKARTVLKKGQKSNRDVIGLCEIALKPSVSQFITFCYQPLKCLSRQIEADSVMPKNAPIISMPVALTQEACLPPGGGDSCGEERWGGPFWDLSHSRTKLTVGAANPAVLRYHQWPGHFLWGTYAFSFFNLSKLILKRTANSLP